MWARILTETADPNSKNMALVVVAKTVGKTYGDFIVTNATGPQVDGVGLAQKEEFAADATVKLT